MLLFKEELFYELAFQGWISVDFDRGLIFNNHTLSFMGYSTTSGYSALAWRYKGKVYHILQHRLIWMLAHGPIPNGLQINHKNGNKKDNRLYNLEIVTPSENVKHAYNTGLIDIQKISKNQHNYFQHNAHVSSKLMDDQVREILKLRKQNPSFYTIRKLGELFNIGHNNILSILQRKSYKHVVKV